MIYFFLVLSILTFLLFGFDKNAARMNQWRIPEKVLSRRQHPGRGSRWFARHASFPTQDPQELFLDNPDRCCLRASLPGGDSVSPNKQFCVKTSFLRTNKL